MKYDFPECISGDTWKGVHSITILENNNPLNLDNCDIVVHFRKKEEISSPVYLEMSTFNNKIKVVSSSLGIISIPSQLILLPEGSYFYDLEVIFPNKMSKTFLYGDFIILPQTTRTILSKSIYAPIGDQKLILAGDDDRILTTDGERLNYI